MNLPNTARRLPCALYQDITRWQHNRMCGHVKRLLLTA